MDDEPSVRSSAVRGNFTSGRRPLGSSSSVLKVPIVAKRTPLTIFLATVLLLKKFHLRSLVGSI